MRRIVASMAVLLAAAGSAGAHGLLIPEEKSVAPLAMLNHKVSIAIEDQVAVTRVEQTFRNHTDRNLEATYVFPVPKGASVNKFSMWVDGKEVKGELVEAKKARQIYISIVRRTEDPGLLEYLGNDLLQMKVFPIAPKSDQRVSLSYSSVSDRAQGVVEYVYPLKTDGKATATLQEFSIMATIKSQHGVSNVYSPTHAISLKRATDKEVTVNFDKNQAVLDKDFQLFYALSDKDVALTALTHRPVADENGYFTLLVTPKVEIPKEYRVPRDMVFVLDTSGSMRGVKMDQARKALRYCVEHLDPKDRFALINFATTVNRYKDTLTEAGPDQIERAVKWINELEATGGTAIDEALKSALELRGKDEGRTFTVVFFTDGQPTIGETDVAKIMKNAMARNTGSTRIFTFGVGDDVNATFLDQLAENTRAVSTYVRPAEDMEAKTSVLFGKISNPVLANLKLETTGEVSLAEVYPPQLPDLFHGGQMVVMGRFKGKGPAAIKLKGQVGKEEKEFVYELTFPAKTDDAKDFVEHLWARRKVGYLLDQIRANGEKDELVKEVTSLAKKYGIATPYTSYLIVPDAAVPVARKDAPAAPQPVGGPVAPGLMDPAFGGAGGADGKRLKVEDLAKAAQQKPGDLYSNRGGWAARDFDRNDDKGKGPDAEAKKEAKDKFDAYREAQSALGRKQNEAVRSGKLGVDLSVNMNALRGQSRLEQTALRNAGGRNLVELGGVWIDEGYDAKKTSVTVKAQSDAYFKILERQPQIRDVYRLGNHLVWVTPSGTNLIIDSGAGKEQLTDKEIDALFAGK